MAQHEYGTDSAFLNWFIKRQAAGRAAIAASEAEYERHVTAIREQLTLREFQRATHENLSAVTRLANQHGMTLDVYGQFVLKRADAFFAAMLKSYEKYLEWWHGGRMNAQTIELEQARSRLRLADARETAAIEGDKDQRKGDIELKIATDTATNTMDAAKRYNLAKYELRRELHAEAGRLRQEIEDTLVMPGKSLEWRTGQAETLTKSLNKVLKDIEEL